MSTGLQCCSFAGDGGRSGLLAASFVVRLRISRGEDAKQADGLTGIVRLPSKNNSELASTNAPSSQASDLSLLKLQARCGSSSGAL